ncbi:hypothetical protein F2P81_018361 [Scophthalmus maximus]|uniref:Uncharacterized protein n=1 Tax=Scophthalmus maximus TaxID=52904 RepID=A0A6A4S220_SCOMX|nr:hypothetical protein F2P81_018361 [Scophthalmus maximus]
MNEGTVKRSPLHDPVTKSETLETVAPLFRYKCHCDGAAGSVLLLSAHFDGLRTTPPPPVPGVSASSLRCSTCPTVSRVHDDNKSRAEVQRSTPARVHTRITGTRALAMSPVNK